jgi:anti-anti-sigma factor
MSPHRPAPILHVRQAGDLTLATVLTDDLSEANAEALGEELSRLLEGSARPRLRLDLARVRFLTSTMLGKLVALHKRVRACGGELTLLNVTGDVYQVFEVTRLHQLLDVRRPGPEDCPPPMRPASFAGSGAGGLDAPDAGEPSGGRPTPSGQCILLVEDDELLRGAMKMVLEWEGYRVACAGDGGEALDYLRGGERPSLILLDIILPGMDGRQFREEQRRDPALAAVPVVVVSALDAADCPEAAAHVRKPFAPQELLEAIRRQG